MVVFHDYRCGYRGGTAQDAAAIGAAYMTHLFMHEMGHQVLADEVGADSHEMSFFTNKNRIFNPDAKFRPLVRIDKKSAALLIQIDF